MAENLADIVRYGIVENRSFWSQPAGTRAGFRPLADNVSEIVDARIEEKPNWWSRHAPMQVELVSRGIVSGPRTS